MKAETDRRRRPFQAAFALFALFCVALVSPLLVSGFTSDPISRTSLRAASVDSLAVTHPVELFATPRVVLESGTISLVSADGAKRNVPLLALLTGRRADLALDGAVIAVERAPAAGEGAGAVEQALISALARLDFRSLSISNSTVILRARDGTSQSLSQVAATVVRNKGSEITADGSLVLRAQPVKFALALSPPGDQGSDAPVPMRAKLSSKLVDVSFSGRLASGDRLQIKAPTAELAVKNIREAASWLGAAWPSGQGLGPFTAKGQLVADEQSVSFENAQVAIDGNLATGALSLDVGGVRPYVQGTLAFDELNLRPYFAAQKQSALALPADWLSHLRLPGLAWPSLIREVDADLRVSAKSVVAGSSTTGRVAASLTTKDGKLLCEVAEAELEQGGTGVGQFVIDMSGQVPAYSVRADLKNADFGKAILARLATTPLEGSGNLTLDLSGKGTDEAAVLSSLTGKVDIEILDGASVAFDADAMAKAAAANPPLPGWGNIAARKVSVDRLVASLTADRGVLTATRIEAALGARVLRAEGSISLADRALDLTLSFAGEEIAVRPASSDHAAGMAYRLRGPWIAPAVTPVTRPGRAAEPIRFEDAAALRAPG